MPCHPLEQEETDPLGKARSPRASALYELEMHLIVTQGGHIGLVLSSSSSPTLSSGKWDSKLQLSTDPAQNLIHFFFVV